MDDLLIIGMGPGTASLSSPSGLVVAWDDDSGPNNHWLVTASEDNTTRLWTLRLDELVDLACRTAGRNLTPEEWEQYREGRTSLEQRSTLSSIRLKKREEDMPCVSIVLHWCYSCSWRSYH